MAIAAVDDPATDNLPLAVARLAGDVVQFVPSQVSAALCIVPGPTIPPINIAAV